MQSAAVTTQKKQTHCECGDPLGIATADQRNSKLMQQGVPQLCMKCLGRVAQEGSAFTQASPAVRQHLENQHALFDQALSGRRPSNVSWLAPNVSPATGSPLRISFDSSPSSQLSRARNYYGGVAHLYLDPSAFMSNGLTAQARPPEVFGVQNVMRRSRSAERLSMVSNPFGDSRRPSVVTQSTRSISPTNGAPILRTIQSTDSFRQPHWPLSRPVSLNR